MTTVQITLPDDLVSQARSFGLLDEARMTALLRHAIRERTAGLRLGQLLAKVDAQPAPAPTEAEIADEIAQARREHARRR